MTKINYPGINEQKSLHNGFIEELSKLKKDYQESGGNITLIISANQMIVNWLTKHISTMDKKIGVFAKTL